MAVKQLTCRGCAMQFTYHRKRAYCSEGCRPSGEHGSPRRAREAGACDHCLAPLPQGAHHNRRYCGQRCARAAESGRRHAAQPICECFLCGKNFRPKRSEVSKFCGRKCGLKWTAYKMAFKATGGRVKVVKFRRKKSKIIRIPPPPPLVSITCRVCGNTFERARGKCGARVCSSDCEAQAARKVREARRLCPKRRAEKKMRKALARGANGAERIDPLRVFERDGWRCGICGNKTLKAKRGTLHDRAPELDHIVALANGGGHNWQNVQCACRACNSRKGARDYGQVPLFAAG